MPDVQGLSLYNKQGGFDSVVLRPAAAPRTPVLIEDVGKPSPKCERTAKGCAKKFPWLSQIGQRKSEKTLHPTPLHPEL